MHFLRPDLLRIDLAAASFEESVRLLSDDLVERHGLQLAAAEVCRSALEREAEASTCLGMGLAVPHCILPAGMEVHAVLGLIRPPLTMPTPDGIPVTCMILLATAEDRREHHVEVLATIARTIGMNDEVRQRLYAAPDAEAAWAVLTGG